MHVQGRHHWFLRCFVHHPLKILCALPVQRIYHEIGTRFLEALFLWCKYHQFFVDFCDKNTLFGGYTKSWIANICRIIKTLWFWINHSSQPHDPLYTGLLRRQVISNHEIKYVRFNRPCFARVIISTTCDISLWINVKCEYSYISIT